MKVWLAVFAFPKIRILNNNSTKPLTFSKDSYSYTIYQLY